MWLFLKAIGLGGNSDQRRVLSRGGTVSRIEVAAGLVGSRPFEPRLAGSEAYHDLVPQQGQGRFTPITMDAVA